MKDGAVLANAGHFDVEIDVRGLAAVATAHREVRPLVDQFVVGGQAAEPARQGPAREPLRRRGPPGRGDGRLVRVAGALGRAPRALRAASSSGACTPCPLALEREVARLKLDSLGVEIDELTPEQAKYLSSWDRLGR